MSTKTIYNVGDLVVLTQDREGIIRFKGAVHGHTGTFYGMEMTIGNGDCNGTLKKVEYFSCPTKKGKFVPIKSIVSKKTSGIRGMETKSKPPKSKKRKLNDEVTINECLEEFLNTPNDILLGNISEESRMLELATRIAAKCKSLEKQIYSMTDNTNNSNNSDSDPEETGKTDAETLSDAVSLIEASEFLEYENKYKFDTHQYKLDGSFSLPDSSKMHLHLLTNGYAVGEYDYDDELLEVKFDLFEDYDGYGAQTFNLIENSKIAEMAKKCGVEIETNDYACKKFAMDLVLECFNKMEDEYWNQRSEDMTQLSEQMERIREKILCDENSFENK